MTTESLYAAGGPRRGSKGRQRNQRNLQQLILNSRIRVFGRNRGRQNGYDDFTSQDEGSPRDSRSLTSVFPFVGGERGGQIRDLDPTLHHARHDEHADHVAHHAQHNDIHDEHRGRHEDHNNHRGRHEVHNDHHGHHEDPNDHHGHHEEHNDHHNEHHSPNPEGFSPFPNTIFDPRGARQRNRNNNNDVSLDIGSIAAAGERCIDKVVMVTETEYDDVITCKHSYTERCHTTYTTDFEPQQEEECEENFIKNCFIEYKKVAGKESVEFCHTPLVCEGEGPTECKTVYESQCQTRYEAHDVEDDVVECETIQDEKCEDVTQGYTTEQKCTKWPREVCEKTTKRVTKHSPQTDCRKVPRELCGPSGCQLTAGPEECFDREETVVQEV